MSGRAIKLTRRISPAQWAAYADAGWELLCQVPTGVGRGGLHLAVTLTVPLASLGEPIPTWLRIVASGDNPVIPGINDKTPAASLQPPAEAAGQGAAAPSREGTARQAPSRAAAPDQPFMRGDI